MIYPQGYVPYEVIERTVYYFIHERVMGELKRRAPSDQNAETKRSVLARVLANVHEAANQFARTVNFKNEVDGHQYVCLPDGGIFRVDHSLFADNVQYDSHPNYWAEELEPRDRRTGKRAVMKFHATVDVFKESFWVDKIIDPRLSRYMKSLAPPLARLISKIGSSI